MLRSATVSGYATTSNAGAGRVSNNERCCPLHPCPSPKVRHEGAEGRSRRDRLNAVMLHGRWGWAPRGRIAGSVPKPADAAWG